MDEGRPPEEGEGGGDWQPPEPSGPEPDLGPQSPAQPPPQQPQQPQQPPPPPQQPPPPPPQQAPPPQPQAPAQPPPQAPPPAYPPAAPPGYPPSGYPPAPPGYPPPQQPQQPQWSGVREPGNGQAVAGFSLSVTGVALIFFSAGFSSIFSLICCILGTIFGRKGKQNVDEGRTTKHLQLARAGFIVGLIGIALSILATVAWTLIFVLADWSDDSGTEFNFDSSSVGRVVALAARATLI